MQTRTADVVSIGRPSLHDQAATRLRSMPIESDLAPRAKRDERALCECLSVSPTPLRDAIELLAAEGMVGLLPDRGVVAVKPGEDDVVHTFELLAVLEGRSGALAAVRVTDAARAEITALHDEMLAGHARRDLSGYYRINARIHRTPRSMGVTQRACATC